MAARGARSTTSACTGGLGGASHRSAASLARCADELSWYYLAVSLVRPARWFIAPWPIALIHVMPDKKGTPAR